MAETREENVYLPKLTEKAAERCEEMVKFMEKVAYKNVEERSIILCSTKDKNVTRAWQWLDNENRVSLIWDYRGKIESELTSICEEILNFLDTTTRFVSLDIIRDHKLFCYKMKGD